MEGANEAARHAVNALLDRDGHAAPRCRIWPLHEPLALAPLREYDAVRFGLGLPWDGGLVTVAAAAVEAADPVLGPVAAALAGMAPDTQQLQSTLDQLDRATPAPRGSRRPGRTHRAGAGRRPRRARGQRAGARPRDPGDALRAEPRHPAAAAGRCPRRPGRVRRAPRLVPRPDAHRDGRRHPDDRTPRAPLLPAAHVRRTAEQRSPARALPGRLPGLRRPGERCDPLGRGHRDAAQRVPRARRHRGRQRVRGAAARHCTGSSASRSRSTSATR